MPTARLRAFAKINLGLRVLNKRSDGYHEIRTIYQTIALHDRLQISIDKSRSPKSLPVSLTCNTPELPLNTENLVFRAAALWRKACKFRGQITIHLEKCIPTGAGLGGGSSDAAATLLGLESLAAGRMDPVTLYRLACELGSDVPLFLVGGRVIGCGRGEEVYPLEDLPVRPCLIIFPGFSVATAEAYRVLGESFSARLSFPLTKIDAVTHTKSFGAWPPPPLGPGPQDRWVPAENDFERFVFARWPELAKLKRQLLRAGAEIASLTGSGSAVYAIFASARELTQALNTALVIPDGWEIFRTRTVPRREYKRLFLVK